jgi:hypothetical protein
MGKNSRILVTVIAAAVFFPAAAGAQPRRPEGKLVPGSRAQQLVLLEALNKQLAGTLVAELNQNKNIWSTLSPEQLRELRQRYYAFLRQDPSSQADLIQTAEQFRHLSDEQREAYRQRAEWLSKVVATLTPHEREELIRMTPTDRAKRLLEVKARIVDSQPTSLPATLPTSP